jgi:hypothetical protein
MGKAEVVIDPQKPSIANQSFSGLQMTLRAGCHDVAGVTNLSVVLILVK